MRPSRRPENLSPTPVSPAGDSLVHQLNRLRPRLAAFTHNDSAAEDSSAATPTSDSEPLGAISVDRVQAMSAAFQSGLEQLIESCAIPNATLHLLRRQERGLPIPPPPFGMPGSSEDIWATFLCHIGPLCHELLFHNELPPSQASAFDRAPHAQSLASMIDAVMIDWAQLHPETQHPLPRAINNARTRQIPSLPSWVHPVDIISFWNPTKGLTDSTSLNASHTWLSDIKKRMGNPTLSTRPGQLPLLPFNLRQAMMELGPIVGGKWRQYPTREQQMEMLERYGLAEMDIARSDDDEVLPILANDQKLRHWAQKQKKPAGQSVTQHDFAGSSDRPSTPKDRLSNPSQRSRPGSPIDSARAGKRIRLEPDLDAAQPSRKGDPATHLITQDASLQRFIPDVNDVDRNSDKESQTNQVQSAPNLSGQDKPSQVPHGNIFVQTFLHEALGAVELDTARASPVTGQPSLAEQERDQPEARGREVKEGPEEHGQQEHVLLEDQKHLQHDDEKQGPRDDPGTHETHQLKENEGNHRPQQLSQHLPQSPEDQEVAEGKLARQSRMKEKEDKETHACEFQQEGPAKLSWESPKQSDSNPPSLIEKPGIGNETDNQDLQHQKIQSEQNDSLQHSNESQKRSPSQSNGILDQLLELGHASQKELVTTDTNSARALLDADSTQKRPSDSAGIATPPFQSLPLPDVSFHSASSQPRAPDEAFQSSWPGASGRAPASKLEAPVATALQANGASDVGTAPTGSQDIWGSPAEFQAESTWLSTNAADGRHEPDREEVPAQTPDLEKEQFITPNMTGRPAEPEVDIGHRGENPTC